MLPSFNRLIDNGSHYTRKPPQSLRGLIPVNQPPVKKKDKALKYYAEAVKNYFVMNGISNGRIVVVGNGSSNPVVDNDTDEHRAMNRRTDVSFKIIE